MHGRCAGALTLAALLTLHTLLQWYLSFKGLFEQYWIIWQFITSHAIQIFFKIQCGGSGVGRNSTYVNS